MMDAMTVASCHLASPLIYRPPGGFFLPFLLWHVRAIAATDLFLNFLAIELVVWIWWLFYV